MASQAIQAHRDTTDICCGDGLYKKKILRLLKELFLSLGFLPMEQVEEVGYDKGDSFLWVAQKKKMEHTFKVINQKVSYDTEIMGFIEVRKTAKLTGVKTRELLLWLTVTDVYIDDPASKNITFKTGTGLSESFPLSAFDAEN